MRLARLYITLTLVILASCEDPSTKDEPITSTEEKDLDDVQDFKKIIQDDEDIDTFKIIAGNPRDLKDGKLPVLPPIILLDFANDLDNSSASGEEKSKRTVDSSLGYGFGRNNLFTGKYNYYFPAGKSGTSVSIEESVSPFLPKTIIETVKPITEKTQSADTVNIYGQQSPQKNNYQSVSGPRTNGQAVQTPTNHFLGTKPVYGQRTRLYKPSQIDYGVYQTFSPTPRPTVDVYTTSRPDYRVNPQSPSQNSYPTGKSNYPAISYSSGFSQIPQTSPRPYQGYSTQPPASNVSPTASSYQTVYSVNSANNHVTLRPTFDVPTTQRTISQAYPSESPLASFAHLPRYTIENGVRYENKIVWKYPDGKVSQSPPTSYVNAYNEFLTKQKPGAVPPVTGYQNAGVGSYQNPGGTLSYQAGSSGQTVQHLNYQSSQPSQIRYQVPAQENRYPVETLSNIHSKGPAQFPNDQPSRPSRPSQFVSSMSLGSGNYASPGSQSSQAQSYETSYQGQYGQKTSLRGSGGSSVSSSGYRGSLSDDAKRPKDSYGSTSYEKEQPISKYAVDSPNPEYTYTTDSPPKSITPSSSTSLFTPSGSLSPKVLSKYSSQAQKYLTKVFATATTTVPSSSDETYNDTPSPYAAENYDNLLNYNPSITQYIRDPSSILNAQPTFIQAGNSLIPVIILRVDGAPPIRPKITPNINLKAILRQYLTQYAGIIGQNANYQLDNYGKDSKVPSTPPQNPLYELTQLAQSLTQYSRNPSIADQFTKQLEGNLNQNSYDNSYGSAMSYEANGQIKKNDDYGRKTSKQKVKSVQIIEDPRFTSYKLNS